MMALSYCQLTLEAAFHEDYKNLKCLKETFKSW